jgi:hypothetical protein
MTIGKKPGENTGKKGGIFREQGPRGGLLNNYATVADNKSLPPTSKAGNTWISVKTTPDSKK